MALPRMVFAKLAFDDAGVLNGLGLPEGDLLTTTLNLVDFVLGFFGLTAVIMIIYGGFTYLTAGGNEEKVESAKDTLRRAVVGMVIVMLSYAIVTFVFNVVNSGFVTKP